MTCVRIPGGIVTLGGPFFTTKYKGRKIHFEWHRFFGPSMLNRHGDPVKNTPDWFWKAIKHWERKMRARGWKPPAMPGFDDLPPLEGI